MEIRRCCTSITMTTGNPPASSDQLSICPLAGKVPPETQVRCFMCGMAEYGHRRERWFVLDPSGLAFSLDRLRSPRMETQRWLADPAIITDGERCGFLRGRQVFGHHKGHYKAAGAIRTRSRAIRSRCRQMGTQL